MLVSSLVALVHVLITRGMKAISNASFLLKPGCYSLLQECESCSLRQQSDSYSVLAVG